MDRIEYANRFNADVGYTTWILKAAINNPNCVIVGRTMNDSYELKIKYFQLLRECNIFKKIIWMVFGRKHPEFKHLDSNFCGLKKPIILDKTCY